MSVEKLPGLFGCKTRKMTDNESKLFITLTMMEMKGGDALQKLDKDLHDKEVFSHQVISKRLEYFKATFSPKLDIGIAPKVWCAMISNSPGQIVMWAHTLNELFVRLGHKVTMLEWTNTFPMGLPTEEEYGRLWNLQKSSGGADILRSDNLIDDFRNWSIPVG
jgi:hypothetical protein